MNDFCINPTDVAGCIKADDKLGQEGDLTGAEQILARSLHSNPSK